jgi:hypothetical protein
VQVHVLAVELDAGVGDQDVQTPERFDGPGHGGLDLFRVRDIRGNRKGGVTGAPQFRSDLPNTVFGDSCQGHLRPFGGHPPGRRRPDPAAAPCDQGDPVLKFHGFLLL